jgi:hypothetical protein
MVKPGSADAPQTSPWAARAVVATVACLGGILCAIPPLFYTGGGQEGLPLLVASFAVGGFIAGFLAAGISELIFPGLQRVRRGAAGVGGAVGFALSALLLPVLDDLPRLVGTWANPIRLVVPLWLGVFLGGAKRSSAAAAPPSEPR